MAALLAPQVLKCLVGEVTQPSESRLSENRTDPTTPLSERPLQKAPKIVSVLSDYVFVVGQLETGWG